VAQYIFFYGTLLPELVPPKMVRAVSQLKAVGVGTVSGRLYDLGNYPGAILGGGRSRIRGRVFELPAEESVLKALDDFEGFQPGRAANEYVRRRCRVVLEDGQKLTCWIYEYNRQPGPARLIPDGDYLKSRQ